MRTSVLAIGVGALSSLTTASHLLYSRQTSEEDYLNSVCSPNGTDPIAPCVQIVNIEAECEPNGTSTLDYVAHQQCMCNGGFFDQWTGCLDCDYVHGGRSPAQVSAFQTILSSASSSLCTGTPTASFAAIFSAIEESNVIPDASGSTSDQYPSQTAVSLYFTATGPTGPGQITGSATAAVATGSTSVSGSDSESSTSGSTSGTASESTSKSSSKASSSGTSKSTTTHSSSASGSAASATSTGGAAAVTQVMGLLAVVAGGVAAAL
jgi:hypothetical protein